MLDEIENSVELLSALDTRTENHWEKLNIKQITWTIAMSVISPVGV